MNKRHTVEKVSTLVFLLLSLAVLAGFVPVRFVILKGITENVLRDMGADSVSVESVTVSLWTGVQVHGLNAYKRINAAEDYRIAARHVDIRVNLPRLGLAWFRSPQQFFDRDMFHDAYVKPLEFVRDVRSETFLPIKKIAARGAGIRFTNKAGKPGVHADGISANLIRRGKTGDKTLGGDANVKEAVIPSLAKIENFHIRFRTDGDRLDLTDGYGAIFGGKINAALSLCLDGTHILSGKARVKGLDLEKFCRITGFSPGRMTGKVSADAVAEKGSPFAVDSIRAKGSISVARLTAEGIALQKAPAVNQVLGELRIMPFSEVRGDFEIADARISFAELAGQGDVLTFRSAGWIGFDGRLSHDFNGEFSPQFVAGLARLIRNGLEPTEDGGGRFRCRITGTIDRPRVDVDRSVYSRAIRNLFR
jgi:hypothetical protein